MEPVAVYFVRIDGPVGDADALIATLNRTQAQRIARMKNQIDRDACLLSHLLLRALACSALGVSGRELDFGQGRHGKPFLPDHPSFRFSISHTRGAVACAVGERELGVDVERLRTWNPRLAARFYTPLEQAYVQGSDLRFTQIWTRKEAYCKYTGEGLSRPLATYCTAGGPLAASIATVEREGFVLSLCPCHKLPQIISWTQERVVEEYRKIAE